MPDAIRLRPPAPFSRTFRPPGSKSLTNRALPLAAIARGRSVLSGCLESQDTVLMRGALGELGVGTMALDPTTWAVDGVGGPLPADGQELFVGTAGTAARFLTAMLAASPGRVRMDGTPRMRQRPMAMLLDGLRDQGARITCLDEEGFLPIEIGPHDAALRGGEVRLTRPVSSQFVSGLAMAATLADTETRIVLEQGTPARPYVDMTLAVLRQFGADARWAEGDTVVVVPGPLHGHDHAIEPDASGASYFLGLAAIHGGTAEIEGLGTDSLQGDVHFADVLRQMGAHVRQDATRTVVEGATLHGVELDLEAMPDMTLTAAVAALFASGTTEIRGVSILRHHESDRLAAAATELRKLGATVVEHPDGLTITGPAGGPRSAVEIDTYDDHRVAMAFALVGDVVIHDPEVVAKTFPRYFNELDNLGMVVQPG